MGFNLGACAVRVSSLLYLMPFFLYFCSRFSLLDDRGRLGASFPSWWRKVLLRRKLLEDGMDGPWGFGMMGWLVVGGEGM